MVHSSLSVAPRYELIAAPICFDCMFLICSGCANDEVCASGAQEPGFEARHLEKQTRQYQKNI